MANHLSAKKRIVQTIKKTAQNRSVLSRMRNLIKKVDVKIKAKDADQAKEALRLAQPAIMKTAQRGIIHKNTASRYMSRLVARIKSI